jgi:allantoinase
VRADALAHRHAVTPYAGTALRGVVRQTWLGGRIVFDHEQVRQPA